MREVIVSIVCDLFFGSYPVDSPSLQVDPAAVKISGGRARRLYRQPELPDRFGLEQQGAAVQIPLYLSYILIFVSRVADVSLGTLRIIYLTRGRSKLAASVGFVEVLIYIVALATVMEHLMDRPLSVFIYAFGFAAGNYVGSWVEERVAVGFVNVQVVLKQLCYGFEDSLREMGFGVTTVDCFGKEGPHSIHYVLMKRRDLPLFLQKVKEIDKDAFISIMDTRKIMGGYFNRLKAK